MEQNMPIIAKRFWNIVRVALFMLRKGISKSKLLADLNMMMKRGKIAGKAIQNLMFHHTHHRASTSSAASSRSDGYPEEYEFSCSNTPAHPAGFHMSFHLSKRKNKRAHHAPPEDESVAANAAVMKAFEMLQSETASPALPGFGKTPLVRQLRVTDSPFPLREFDEDNHVDEAAELFIKRFYKDLRRQNSNYWDNADG